MGYFKNIAIEQAERERMQAQMYGEVVNRDSIPAVMIQWRDFLTPAERVEVIEDVLEYELWGELLSQASSTPHSMLMKQAIYG